MRSRRSEVERQGRKATIPSAFFPTRFLAPSRRDRRPRVEARPAQKSVVSDEVEIEMRVKMVFQDDGEIRNIKGIRGLSTYDAESAVSIGSSVEFRSPPK